MKILVTGASGFIGRAVVEALKSAGRECLTPSSQELNLFDGEAVRQTLAREKPTHLVHAAWRNVRGDVMASHENFDWLRASLDLARAFYDAGGTRAAFLGTSAEYDWRYGVMKTGQTPLVPSTPYGAAKCALRHGVDTLARAQGCSYVWPRIFFVYGPGEHVSRLSMAVSAALLRGEAVDLTHGRQIRDYTFVGDVGRGVCAALLSDLHGETDLVSGAPYSVRDVASAIGRAIGREDLLRFGARPSPAHDLPVVLGDPEHARVHLGWTAQTSLDDGVGALVAFARAQIVN